MLVKMIVVWRCTKQGEDLNLKGWTDLHSKYQIEAGQLVQNSGTFNFSASYHAIDLY